MTFIIESPIVHAEEAKPAEKSSLCGTTIIVSSEEAEVEDDEDWDDDWDEDDEEGVEFIYKR